MRNIFILMIMVLLPLFGSGPKVETKATHFPFFTKSPLRTIKLHDGYEDEFFFRPMIDGFYEVYLQVFFNNRYFTLTTLKENCRVGQNYRIRFKHVQRTFRDSKTVRMVVVEDNYLHPYYYFDVSYPDSNTVYPEKLYNKNYNPNGKLTELIYNEGPRYIDETFYFGNYGAYRMEQIYYEFKLNFLNFSYELHYENLLGTPARLCVYDPRLLFPKFSHDSDQKFYLDLTMDYNPYAREYYFEFIDPLYYEKDTMVLSPYQEAGFLPTDRFYFPLNSFSSGRQTKFCLEVGPMGYNQITVHYTFTLMSRRPYYSRNAYSNYYLSSSDDTVEEWGVTMSEEQTNG